MILKDQDGIKLVSGKYSRQIIDLGRTEARVSGEIKDPNQYALLYDIRQFKGNGLISFVPRVEV